MKKQYLLFIAVLALSGCTFDQYQIREGNRKPVFIQQHFQNTYGHLYWIPNRNDRGRIVYQKYTPVLFDTGRDTIIYVHGWGGIGQLGWTQHRLMTGPGVFMGPLAILFSLMYNLPDNGASFPDFRKKIGRYNIAVFNWEEYNNIAEEYETTENLAVLERNLKSPPKGWPDIPGNLAEEIRLFVRKTSYGKSIIIHAHSLGNQVVLRAYDQLEDEYRQKIKWIVLSDPFLSTHYNYMSEKVKSDIHWLAGVTNPDINQELLSIIEKNKLSEKLRVIVRTDIGYSYAQYIAKPSGIQIVDDQVKSDVNGNYAWMSKREHDRVLDYLFLQGKYDKELNIDW